MRRGRRTLAERLAAANLGDRYYAAMYGKQPQAQAEIPVVQKRTRSASGQPLERHVLRAVLAALRSHPRVAWFTRQQSGLFMEGERTIRVGYRGLPDIVGMLRGGRLFCVECKSATGRVTSEQQKTLDNINRNGGLAFVARSVEDVFKALQ